MVEGMRKPMLRRIVGAQHFGQSPDRCFSRGTLTLAVEIVHKNPPYMIFGLAFDGEAIVALSPCGDEIAGPSDS